MAKTRISISLEPDQAERIRTHAERAGLDVSAYLVNAAIRQMAEAEAIEAQFTRVDAMIAAAGAEGASLGPLPEATPDELTEEERRQVQEAMDLVYGTDRSATRPTDAA
jgi:hypothetical protein